jgi:hypothetical protein
MSQSVLRTFANRTYELLGGDVPFDDIQSMCSDYLKAPSAGSIESYIRQSSHFEDKHRSIILKVHGIVSPSGPLLATNVVDSLIKNFRLDPSYNVDRLKDDLEAQGRLGGCEEPPIQEVKVLPFHQMYLTYDAKFVNVFESSFGRSMCVQEYFEYKNRFETHVEFGENIVNLKKRFEDVYQEAHTAYRNFLDKDLTVHMFIKEHFGLFEFEQPEFMSHLIEGMISSQIYTTCMRKNIQDSYKTLYNLECPDEDEFEYMLRRLKNLKMPIADSSLTSFVGDYMRESHEIGLLVDSCYSLVLRRNGDPDELEVNIKTFRRMIEDMHIGDDECVIHLRKDLIATLEFHDIIKEMIKETHPNLTRTSQRYTMLNNVIRAITNQHDFEDIKVLVKDAII